MINKKNFRNVVEVIQDLQKVTDIKHFHEQTLNLLETLFNASNSVILDWTSFVQGAQELGKDDMFFHKFEKQAQRDYPNFHHQDPIFDWVDSGRCREDLDVTRLSDLVDFKEIEKTDFYRTILAPLNCRYVLTMAAHQNDNIEASISMIRPSEVGDFDQSDVQLAQLITPVLANAYTHLLLKRKSELNDDILKIIASQLKHMPYAIFSSNLESVYRSDQMTLLGRQLRGAGNSINDIFSKSPSIASYIKLFTSAKLSQHKRLPEKISDSVSIGGGKMVKMNLQLFILSSTKRYLLSTIEMTNSDNSLSALQRNYGLTMRENQIALLAARGLSSKVIGEELAISFWSVKNHLKNIYKKTKVNSRALLAQVINKH